MHISVYATAQQYLLSQILPHTYIILYIVGSTLFFQLQGARTAAWDIVGQHVLTSELRDLTILISMTCQIAFTTSCCQL